MRGESADCCREETPGTTGPWTGGVDAGSAAARRTGNGSYRATPGAAGRARASQHSGRGTLCTRNRGRPLRRWTRRAVLPRAALRAPGRVLQRPVSPAAVRRVSQAGQPDCGRPIRGGTVRLVPGPAEQRALNRCRGKRSSRREWGGPAGSGPGRQPTAYRVRPGTREVGGVWRAADRRDSGGSAGAGGSTAGGCGVPGDERNPRPVADRRGCVTRPPGRAGLTPIAAHPRTVA